MLNDSYIKKALAVCFSLMIFAGAVRSGAYLQFSELSHYLVQHSDLFRTGGNVEELSDLESRFSGGLWHRTELINLNGSLLKLMNSQDYYRNIGIYITDDLYIVSPADQISTEYELGELLSLRDFLEENGIELLYVNEPTKYLDDGLFREQFAVDTYSNRNMDLFLSRIRGAGINAIDLREAVEAEGKDIREMFYRTDHHWTTQSGLWAAERIAKGLNEFCGYDIDLSIYDEENFTFREWKECWLGEQGKKVAASYVGLDDYTEIKPIFSTSYSFPAAEEVENGSFNDFIDESIYLFEGDPYDSPSWHYSYHVRNCINHDVPEGKVLLLSDSYSSVMEPFLSLGIHRIDNLCMRDTEPGFKLRDYILKNDYDTVLICYAQFMLGAHDDPSSSNYRMFEFDR